MGQTGDHGPCFTSPIDSDKHIPDFVFLTYQRKGLDQGPLQTPTASEVSEIPESQMGFISDFSEKSRIIGNK